MSCGSSGNGKCQVKRDLTSNPKVPVKCRIPQRQNKTNLNQSPRPKSSGGTGHQTLPTAYYPPCPTKPDRLVQNPPGKTFTMTKRFRDQNKQIRNPRAYTNGRTNLLPKQETLSKEEDREIQDQFSYDDFEPLREVNPDVKESVSSMRGKMVNLKICWQEQMDRFDNLKMDLGERQAELMKLYASICKTHEELLASGQKTVLPPPDELSIMNVAKMTPEQLLQLCVDADKNKVTTTESGTTSPKDPLAVDKFYDVSSKLVNTCQKALEKRKSILDWFDKLMKMANNGISINKLNEKVREFNEENEGLRECLDRVRSEFFSEMKDIVEHFREAVNDSISNQLRAEDLTYKLSEVNAENLVLKKSLHSLEHTRKNKHKIDQLEKDLSEERRKTTSYEQRAEIAEAKLTEKEIALETLNEHANGLEQTIQELNVQNHQLQENFDKELNKLMDSITKNTENLREIATAREKLQAEKEHIERFYKEQSHHYVDEIKKLKEELDQEIDKRIETDSKYLEMLERKKLLEPIVENMQQELKETVKRYAESQKKIKCQEEELDVMKEQLQRLEVLKGNEIEEVRKKNDNYKSALEMQNSTILQLQLIEKETKKELKDKTEQLGSKEQYITSLEIKQAFLESQLRESELKMSSYEEQLSKIKNDIHSIQDAWGHFENLDQLNEMINQQRHRLEDTTNQIRVLKGELDMKENELKSMKEKLEMQKFELNEKEATVNALAAKDEEHRNVIKLMKENFDLRTQTDAKLNRELADKDAEISTLLNALEKTKEQFDHLKKIVYTIKEEAEIQKDNDKEVITMLENKLAEVDSENRQSINNPENFDSLLQILEDELQSPYKNEERSNDSRRSPKRRVNRENINKHEKYCRDESPSSLFQTEQGQKATKIVMGNFVKKTYFANNDEDGDQNLDRKKKGATKLETQRWLPIQGTGIGAYEPSLLKKNRNDTYNGLGNLDELKEKYLSRNLQFVIPNLLQEEKQSRMFRFAKHRM